MIRYSLRCDAAHAFETWFRDSDAFDTQKTAGFVTCPVCGSADVSKALMAPSVVTSRRKSAVTAPLPAPVPPSTPAETGPVALVDEKALKLRALMRDVRDYMIQNSHDVGAAFPEEARKIHEGVAEHRAIRGEASPDDVRALIEDGIDIMPVPTFPEDRN